MSNVQGVPLIILDFIVSGPIKATFLRLWNVLIAVTLPKIAYDTAVTMLEGKHFFGRMLSNRLRFMNTY